ncbi:MAG: hypothetical protein OHK0015_47990 [Chloroflexi bacterium OHK40]
MSALRHLHWPLILGLSALTLIHPLLNVTGVMARLRPAGPLLVTALIVVVWIAAVVRFGLDRPVATLACTGFVAGLGAMVAGALLSLALTGTPGPFLFPVGIVAAVAVNTLLGVLAGLIALVIQRGLARETVAGR